MKMCGVNCFWQSKKGKLLPYIYTAVLLVVSITVNAQDGIAGIKEADSKVREYFKVGCNLMYAVGAVLGLIGAIRVYSKWSQGHPDTGSTAGAWFGSCIFLVLVATVIKTFFGL